MDSPSLGSEIGTSSMDWAQNNKLYLMKETQPSLRNVVFVSQVRQWIMSKKFITLTIYRHYKLSDFKDILGSLWYSDSYMRICLHIQQREK
jgi:uncharacterized protein YchJ